MVSRKLPGGFNITLIKGHLSKACRLGPSHSDGDLFLGTVMEPAKLLGSEAEAGTQLDTVMTMYAQCSGISLSAGGLWVAQVAALKVQLSTVRSLLTSRLIRNSLLRNPWCGITNTTLGLTILPLTKRRPTLPANEIGQYRQKT
jgi:hypothetical protein